MTSFILDLNDSDTAYLVPLPHLTDFNDFLYALEKETFIEVKKIKMDVIIFSGDRQGRYLEFKINKGLIDVTSAHEFIPNDKFKNFVVNSYLRMNDYQISKIYPISFRKHIIKKKEEASKASS